MLCFYHSADLDGACSAAIVTLYHPSCDLHPINHGDRFPWEKIHPHCPVWMLDFSLPIDQMIELGRTTHLVWIDHHKTAIEDARRAGANFRGLQRVGTGACQLVWEYLEPGKKPPEAVLLLAQYDVWQHSDPLCLPLQYGLRSHSWSREPRHLAWRELLRRVDSPTRVRELAIEGEAVLRYTRQQDVRLARVLCFDHVLELSGGGAGRLRCLAANWPMASSSVVQSAWDPQRHDAILLYYYVPRTDAWRVSLYSDRPEVDVSPFARAFGGGGHRGAAGFQISSLAQIGL